MTLMHQIYQLIESLKPDYLTGDVYCYYNSVADVVFAEKHKESGRRNTVLVCIVRNGTVILKGS